MTWSFEVARVRSMSRSTTSDRYVLRGLDVEHHFSLYCSCGGMIAFIDEIVFSLLLSSYSGRVRRAAAGLLAVCFSVVSLLIFIRKKEVLGRLGDLEPSVRLNMTTDCLRMFLHRPALGWGLGTFAMVYPSYRSFYTNLFINEARND